MRIGCAITIATCADPRAIYFENHTARAITVHTPPLGDIAAACQKVRAWIAAASIDDLSLIARALQLRVRATKRQGELIGVIPAYAPSCSDADVRPVVSTDGYAFGGVR